jgi:hypothetical protein
MIKKAAKTYIQAGLSVVPTGIDKIPRVKKWKDREKEIPSKSTVEKEFSKPGMCVAIVCGKVSGNVETIDFDFKAEMFEDWAGLVEQDAPSLIQRLVIQSTQSGGAHVTYKCSQEKIPSSQKLATKWIEVDPDAADENGEHEHSGKKFKAIERGGNHYINPTYVETRGEAGYFLAYPSPGYEIRQGRFSNPPDITPEEREILIEAALSLSDRPPGDPVTGPKPTRGDRTALSPGDDYNQRGNVEQLLIDAGWTKTNRRSSGNDGTHWRRPGKDKGQSATLYDGSNVLHVFTASGAPFVINESYSPFAIYAYLEHEEDFSAAAKTLAAQGYGDQSKPYTESSRDPKTPEEWSIPVSLDEPDLPKITPEMFPGAIAEIAGAVSEATETPFELAAMLTIATIAAAVQGKMIVEIQPGYFEPLNIWIMVALESGARKSAVQRELTRALIDWEKDQREGMKDELAADKIIIDNCRSKLQNLRRKYGNETDPDKLDALEKEILEVECRVPGKKTLPRVWTDDVTPEMLAVLMSENNERMAILSSEGGIVDTIAGRYSNNLPNLDIFLKGYSADPVTVDRISREPIFLTHPTLTIGISPQPIVIQTLIEKHGFRGRGFLSRWLYALPKSNLGYRTNETRPVDESVKARFNSTIKALLSLEPPGGDPSRAHILKISKEAHNDRARFVDHVEIEMREGRQFEHIRDWAGKLPGQAVRLAGLFHAAKHAHIGADGLPIEPDTLKMALNLATILAGHALAAFDLMGQTPDLECAKKILKWIRREINAHRAQKFTRRDLHQALKGTYKKSNELDPGLRVLTDLGYIRPIENKSQGPGRPSEQYEINPKIGEKST